MLADCLQCKAPKVMTWGSHWSAALTCVVCPDCGAHHHAPEGEGRALVLEGQPYGPTFWERLRLASAPEGSVKATQNLAEYQVDGFSSSSPKFKEN